MREYVHRPYEGLASLRGAGFSFSSIDRAQEALGCVPKGRLRRLVMLVCAAAVIQRVRDENGVPLALCRGGLVTQQMLGDYARPTPDIDTSINGSFDEFIDRFRVAVQEPFGPVRVQIEDAHARPKGEVPNDGYFMTLHLWIDSNEGDGAKEPFVAHVEGNYGEPQSMLRVHRYPAAALDALGLPLPDALWGVAPERNVTDKMVCCVEPLIPDEARYAGLTRFHRRAKHLVDLVSFERLYREGHIPGAPALRESLLTRLAYENTKREAYGFVPLAFPVHVLPHDDWELEYYFAAIQAGIDVPYEKAIEIVDAWFAELG